MVEHHRQHSSKMQLDMDMLESLVASDVAGGGAPDAEGWHIVDDDAKGWHIVDDVELLERWSLDDLGGEELQKIGGHLADCPYCRRELARMVEQGILVSPGSRTVPVATRLNRSRRLRQMCLAVAVGAVAATLLLLVAGPPVRTWWTDRQLARVERAYLDSHFREAAQSALQLWNRREDLSDAGRRRLEGLLPQACYQAAREHLQQGQFGETVSLAEQAGASVGETASLCLLRLQAEQGMNREDSLQPFTTLIDFGCSPGGGASKGGLSPQATPPLGPTVFRLKEEFRDAVARYPDSVGLRVNFGEFLLRYRWLSEAEEQFTQAAALDPDYLPAQMGLGMARFLQQQYQAALQHFQGAIAIDGNSAAAHLNAAMCLDELGQTRDADVHWRKVQQLVPEGELSPEARERISRASLPREEGDEPDQPLPER